MIVIVMGVVGSGKTTIGTLLSSQLGWEFADADDYHPQSNVDKIRIAIPLTDRDREPWLDLLGAAIAAWVAAGRNVVLACSALKHSYRKKLKREPRGAVRLFERNASPNCRSPAPPPRITSLANRFSPANWRIWNNPIAR